ncbi:MAG: GntR family transcriptional regulator [Hyphomonas sp.]|nr:GntR family transcriptional regulator [Hyphomonas sp.]MCC0017599.1 GntR family transcriptional regulator [Rhodobiaceae bacterium]
MRKVNCNKDFMSRKPRKLYLDVANRLVKDIKEGRYVTGSLLPTEHELSASFGVSRQTVRSALAYLQERGYISRKKAVGSRVKSANPNVLYRQTYNSIEELVRVATEAEIRINLSINQKVLDKSTARKLEAPLGSRWICFSGVRVPRRHGKQPTSWFNVYIKRDYEEIIAAAEAYPDELIFTLLEREFGVDIVEIRQTISVASLSEEAAEALEAEPNSAGLSIVRHFKDINGEIVEISETIYPSDRISISSRISRASPGY